MEKSGENKIKLEENKTARMAEIRKMYNMETFNNKVYILGFGAIGRSLLCLLVRLVKLDITKVTVYEKKPITLSTAENHLYHNKLKITQVEITEDNYKDLLKDLDKHDLILDCSYGICSRDIIELCAKSHAAYINSCIEEWSHKAVGDDASDTLYRRQKNIEEQNKKLGGKYNAVVCMGCNPGNVSIWAQVGIDYIAQERGITKGTHAEKAREMGLQVIHVSERDSQKSSVPKGDHEYCNTWSTDGEAYSEEILSCVEGTWGSHERELPKDLLSKEDGYFTFNRMAAYTYAQSYVPLNGRYIGNIVPHEECYTIGKNLTIRKNDEIVYNPSVYYVYHACNDARMSVEELKDRGLEMQEKYRLLTKEIISGRDELGLTYFLKDGSVYWIGSLLDIAEAREIYENKYNDIINATAMQVVTGYITGIIYMIRLMKENKYRGTMYAEDLPYKEIFKMSLPFLGEFIFKKVTNFKVLKVDLTCLNEEKETTDWQFKNFLIYK